MIWLIVFLGLILRLISLNQSLWLDEGIQVWASRDFSIKNLLFEYLRGDFNPPLYHILLHFWIKIFGDSEIAVRLPSVFLGVGSIWLLYKIARQFLSPRRSAFAHHPRSHLGSLAALLLATSPLHIYYSQEARMYSLACFAVLFCVWRFLIWQKEKSFKNSILLAISLVSIGFSHYLTLLILPIIWLFEIFTSEESRSLPRHHPRCFRRLFLIHFPLIFLCLFYLPIFKSQLGMGATSRVAFPVWGKTVGSFSLKAASLLPVKFIIGRLSIYNKLAYGMIAGILVTIYWGLAILSAKCKVQSAKLMHLFLFLPPIFGFLISFFVPVFSYFRFLYCVSFFYLLISFGVGDIKRETLKRSAVVFLISVNLVCSFVYLFNPKFHREDWQGAVAWLHQQEKAPVLILSQVSKPLEYYDQGKTNLLFWPNDQEKIVKNDKIWLIEYSLPIFDPQGILKGKLLKMGYVLGEQKAFREILLSFWQKEAYAYRH